MPETQKSESFLSRFTESVRFLTVFPVPGTKNLYARTNSLPGAMIFFPLTGMLIGVLALAFFKLAGLFFPERIAVLVLLVVPIFITGGLHVDGLADFCDGFFGGKTREDKLRIMKDSRIGTWAAAGVALNFLAKYELLAALVQKPIFFLLAVTLSRWTQVILSFYLPYARPAGGLGESAAGKLRGPQVLGATLFVLPVLFLSGIHGLFAALAALFAVCLLGIWMKNKLGGVTGDVLGAASEFTELIVLFTAAGFLHV